ncbi:hypothetical protein PHYBOEH_004744 [Phytophthora boehmeriae]|uniref:Elicitin n=1 Tax=Phytophthora boehmeriae TaxID=109152 RepID=A0A8T1X3M9_9STRA|nr:hypothetical protein PHYBOEH_004744 [Phytophthora boehmeriae]
MLASRAVLLVWCALFAMQAFCTHANTAANSTSSRTTTSTSVASSTSLRATTAPPVANSTESSTSASGTVEETTETEIPTATVATVSSSTAAVSTTTPTTTVNTAYVCSGDEVSRIETLNSNNPYLQSTCSSKAGISSYVFPFNGVLTYAQMVAMSSVSECEYYFRAVLLVQLTECEVANVYVRTTAETVLQLASTSGSTPLEADANAAVEVRKTFNLALRDGNGSASYSATSGASSLTWNIDGDTIDTTSSASINGQLLLSSDLQVIGTYYASSSESANTQVEDSRNAEQSSSSASAGLIGAPWLMLLTIGTSVVLMHVN